MNTPNPLGSGDDYEPADDCTWRGNMYDEGWFWESFPALYVEDPTWAPGEKEARDEALRDVLGDTRVLDEDDEQC